jgi:hypothetical protein
MLRLSFRAALGVTTIVFLFAWTLTTHGKYSASGDEPHYLMIAESLRADGDLNLANNYLQNDGQLFGRDGLQPELHAIPARKGKLHSIHGIGLPVLLLPVHALAQRVAGVTSKEVLTRFRMDRGLFAYSIVSIFLMALTSLGLALLASGLAAITTPGAAAAIAIAVGISPPVVSHSFLVFPEAVALFVTCCTVWFATRRRLDTDLRVAPFIAFSLGALPWVHQKYFVYAVGLMFVLAWTRRDLLHRFSTGQSVLGAALFIAPQVALLWWLRYEWGTFGGALTTGVLTPGTVPLTSDSLRAGSVGLWFDRQSGMLAYAPLFWIAPACWAVTWRRTWPYALPVLLLYLPAAAFVIGWWAGFAPAARYLAPAVPLLTVPFAHALKYRGIRRAAVVVLLMQLPIDVVVWQHPRWLWPTPDGNRALQALGPIGRAYEMLLPSIQMDGLTLQAFFAVSIAVLATAIIHFSAHHEHRERPAHRSTEAD